MTMPMIGISGSMNDLENHIFLLRSYMQSILQAGGIPVLLSPDMDIAAMEACLQPMDGLLFAGGGDVVPARFGEDPIPQLGETTPVRDAFELALLPMAAARKMPVLGICRGVQAMNVALGGTLYQDLPSQYQPVEGMLLAHKQEKPYETPSHTVQVVPDSLLHRLTAQDTLRVNSMHHQSVKDVAPSLCVTAHAPDGVVEALEQPNLPFFLGVQWHPERLTDEASLCLFKGLINAADAYRRNKA